MLLLELRTVERRIAKNAEHPCFNREDLDRHDESFQEGLVLIIQRVLFGGVSRKPITLFGLWVRWEGRSTRSRMYSNWSSDISLFSQTESGRGGRGRKIQQPVLTSEFQPRCQPDTATWQNGAIDAVVVAARTITGVVRHEMLLSSEYISLVSSFKYHVRYIGQ